MKRLLPLLLVLHTAAFAEDSGFVSVPDMSQLLYEGEAQKADLPQDDLIDVHEVNYLRNKKASFCMRPTDMVDTIVIHHSETPSTYTPEDINAYHLNRGSSSDPWYMIAYSFVINSPYEGMALPLPKASVGRPFEIVGAHAGSNIFVPMDSVQTKLWADKKILCGKENQVPKFDPTLVKNKKIKANVTTIGIVVNGNYAAYNGSINPGGYDPTVETRNPTPDTIDMVARLSCQLQKKYPRIKSLAYHNQYHRTTCPGNFTNYMDTIKQKAKEYGCDFKLLSKRY